MLYKNNNDFERKTQNTSLKPFVSQTCIGWPNSFFVTSYKLYITFFLRLNGARICVHYVIILMKKRALNVNAIFQWTHKWKWQVERVNRSCVLCFSNWTFSTFHRLSSFHFVEKRRITNVCISFHGQFAVESWKEFLSNTISMYHVL